MYYVQFCMENSEPYRYLSTIGSSFSASRLISRAMLFQSKEQAKTTALALISFGSLQTLKIQRYIIREFGKQDEL